jgi:hypothetical protein
VCTPVERESRLSDPATSTIPCSLQVSFRLDNVWRDQQYGKPDPNDMVDTSELADKVKLLNWSVSVVV